MDQPSEKTNTEQTTNETDDFCIVQVQYLNWRRSDSVLNVVFQAICYNVKGTMSENMGVGVPEWKDTWPNILSDGYLEAEDMDKAWAHWPSNPAGVAIHMVVEQLIHGPC